MLLSQIIGVDESVLVSCPCFINKIDDNYHDNNTKMINYDENLHAKTKLTRNNEQISVSNKRSNKLILKNKN